MHESVVLLKLSRIRLRGEPGQSLFVYINSKWLIRGYNYIDSEIKLVTVDKKWIRYVARDDRSLIHVQLIQRLNKADAFALGGIGWLDDPDIALRFRNLQFLIVCVEVVKFVWKDVSVGNEIEVLPTEFFLHLDIVVTKTIFASDLVTLREVVDPLKLV